MNLDVETQEEDVPLKEDNSWDNAPVSSSQTTDDSSDDDVIPRSSIPIIIAEKKTCKLTNKPLKYGIILKDTLGDSIGHARVTLKIDGKVYTAITDGSGRATFKITNLNKKGKLKASITFDGDEDYKKITLKGKIVVKDTFSVISKNSKDKSAVKKVQHALKDNGYYITYKGHYLKVDGWYGPCTFKSVKQFQKAKKLKVTGKVDGETAAKLKIIGKSKYVSIKFGDGSDYNAVIKFENDKPFKRDYNSGKSFKVKIADKNTGKGIATVLNVDYFKDGNIFTPSDFSYLHYYTGENGENFITPDFLEVGTYKMEVSCIEPKIKAHPKYKKIIITKTSIRMKADVVQSKNQKVQLKVSLLFKRNSKVDEGKVKFTVGGKSYTVKVHDGEASKSISLKNVKLKEYSATFLGTKNIKAKTVTVKIQDG